jgi:hypothetical protein
MFAIVATITSPVPCGGLIVSPAGKIVTAFCRDHKMRVFSLADGKLLRTLMASESAVAVTGNPRRPVDRDQLLRRRRRDRRHVDRLIVIRPCRSLSDRRGFLA